MKNIFSILLLVALCTPFTMYAQKPGFYGKKFTLQFGLGGHHNTLQKLLATDERQLRSGYYSNTFNKSPYVKSNQFNYSLFANVGITAWKRASFSLDFQYYFGKRVDYYEYTDFNQGTQDIGYVQLAYSGYRIMPRLEVYAQGSDAPVGLTNVFGVGIESLKIADKEYYLIPTNSPDDVRKIRIPDINRMRPLAIVLQYGLEYRHPITKSIYLNMGAYAHLNIPIRYSEFGLFSFGNEYFNNHDYKHPGSNVANARMMNLFSARFGIMFAL